MLNALFAVVILAAVGAMGWRRFSRARLLRAAAQRPGASVGDAIWVRSFDEIDEHLEQRWCGRCGGYLEKAGEGTREDGDRRFRIVRFVCQDCDESERVFFDTTEIMHYVRPAKLHPPRRRLDVKVTNLLGPEGAGFAIARRELAKYPPLKSS